MTCCVCIGSCSHIGPHSYCAAHAPNQYGGWSPTYYITTTSAGTSAEPSDGETLRRAARILRRRSTRPDSLMLRILCHVLASTADDIETEAMAS